MPAVLVAVFLLIIWIGKGLVPRLLLAIANGSADDINKLLLALAGLVGAPFLVWRTWIADRQRHVAQEELNTSLLTKAVELLGATREEKTHEINIHAPTGVLTKPEAVVRTVPNTEVRLGAIYALEKLAQDYLPLHWQIMEILCAYVRKNAGLPKPCSEEIRAIYAKGWEYPSVFREEAALKPRKAELKSFVDVQAALTVIGRRSKKHRKFETDRLDLRNCHLAGVDSHGLHFAKADFSGSRLEHARLHDVDLEYTLLLGTHLEGASLDRAHLERAMFRDRGEEAHLEGAWLASAHLKGTRLDKVRLEGAWLEGATGLTQKQLDEAFGDDNTTIPDRLSRPDQWRKSKTGQVDIAPQ